MSRLGIRGFIRQMRQHYFFISRSLKYPFSSSDYKIQTFNDPRNALAA